MWKKVYAEETKRTQLYGKRINYELTLVILIATALLFSI